MRPAGLPRRTPARRARVRPHQRDPVAHRPRRRDRRLRREARRARGRLGRVQRAPHQLRRGAAQRRLAGRRVQPPGRHVEAQGRGRGRVPRRCGGTHVRPGARPCEARRQLARARARARLLRPSLAPARGPVRRGRRRVRGRAGRVRGRRPVVAGYSRRPVRGGRVLAPALVPVRRGALAASAPPVVVPQDAHRPRGRPQDAGRRRRGRPMGQETHQRLRVPTLQHAVARRGPRGRRDPVGALAGVAHREGGRAGGAQGRRRAEPRSRRRRRDGLARARGAVRRRRHPRRTGLRQVEPHARPRALGRRPRRPRRRARRHRVEGPGLTARAQAAHPVHAGHRRLRPVDADDRPARPRDADGPGEQHRRPHAARAGGGPGWPAVAHPAARLGVRRPDGPARPVAGAAMRRQWRQGPVRLDRLRLPPARLRGRIGREGAGPGRVRRHRRPGCARRRRTPPRRNQRRRPSRHPRRAAHAAAQRPDEQDGPARPGARADGAPAVRHLAPGGRQPRGPRREHRAGRQGGPGRRPRGHARRDEKARGRAPLPVAARRDRTLLRGLAGLRPARPPVHRRADRRVRRRRRTGGRRLRGRQVAQGARPRVRRGAGRRHAEPVPDGPVPARHLPGAHDPVLLHPARLGDGADRRRRDGVRPAGDPLPQRARHGGPHGGPPAVGPRAVRADRAALRRGRRAGRGPRRIPGR